MPAPYINECKQVNTSSIVNNNIAEGSTIRFVRAWDEDELPTARNFVTAVVEAVRRTANGFAIYETREGAVWFDRVLSVEANNQHGALAA